MKTAVVALLYTMLAVVPAQAAHAQVQLGSATLSLGEDQATVMDRLRRHHRVLRIDQAFDDGSELWFVGRSTDPQSLLDVGSVVFRDGMLVSITRQWGNRLDASSIDPTLNAVISALHSVGRSGGMCMVRDESPAREPGTAVLMVTLSCGTVSLVISAGTVAGGNVVASITETYSRGLDR